MKYLLIIGLLFCGVAHADIIEDKATELAELLEGGTATQERIDSEIVDATIRVKRRYVDDENVETITTGGYTVEAYEVPAEEAYIVDAKWIPEKKETKLKEPSTGDIVSRLQLKINSVKKSLKNSKQI